MEQKKVDTPEQGGVCNATPDALKKRDPEIEQLKEKLLLSERRFEIAIGFSDVTVFEYNIVTKKIMLQHADYEVFGIPAVLEEGLDELLESGIVAEQSADAMREFYAKIDNGAPTARVIVKANSVDGTERVVELILVSIFNAKGEPVYAVGVRKDITEALMLQKERKYSNTIMSEWMFAYEANITQDRIIRYEPIWAEQAGTPTLTTFSGTVQEVCQAVIDPLSIDLVMRTLSLANLQECYRSGRQLITVEYRRLVAGKGYCWFKQSVNLIQEEMTGDICVRAYIKSIHEEKERERKAQEEQHYYESMISKTDALYEFNLTQNTVLKGYEDWDKLFGITKSTNYQQMMAEMCEKSVHPADKENFEKALFQKNLLQSYQAGTEEIVCEYRQAEMQGDFKWLSCTTHLVQEVDKGDIKGYSYVQCVDAQKKEQLELIYKSQRDALTGFYNKATVAEKVSAFLQTSEAKEERHAFFILDLDNFKAINDHFGHAYGDVFLAQTAAKIRSLFREDDLLGRIGGDEFVMLMKNIPSEQIAIEKAAQLCHVMEETCTQGEQNYKVSASIGIALYGVHGHSYADLFRHSDTALYFSKNHGRNRFALYNSNMTMVSTTVKAIDSDRRKQPRTFEENVSEYVFRVLYEAEDKEAAIASVMAIIGKSLNASRAYIFENIPNGHFAQNTFEWCNRNIAPRINRKKELPLLSMEHYEDNFNEEGYFFLENIEESSLWLRRAYKPHGVRSMLQFSIRHNGNFVGFLGLDQCDRLRYPTTKELSRCRNMTNVLAIFLTEMRANQAAMLAKRASDEACARTEAARQALLSVINGLGNFTYVCDRDTLEVLFMNDRLHKLIPQAQVGDFCYRIFRGRDSICPDCAVQNLNEHERICSLGEKFSVTGANMRANISLINWIDGKKACLVDCIDLSEQPALPQGQ